MDLSQDEIAGIVDMFGALTREELDEALDELAFRRNETPAAEIVDDAIDGYAIVVYDQGGEQNDDCDGNPYKKSSSESTTPDGVTDVGEEQAPASKEVGGEGTEDGTASSTYLAPGPTAFPMLPEGAADLPHILDVSARSPNREALAVAVEVRFRRDVARVVDAGDAAEIERLLDVSYDLESWGPVDLDSLRARLDDALADLDSGDEPTE